MQTRPESFWNYTLNNSSSSLLHKCETHSLKKAAGAFGRDAQTSVHGIKWKWKRSEDAVVTKLHPTDSCPSAPSWQMSDSVCAAWADCSVLQCFSSCFLSCLTRWFIPPVTDSTSRLSAPGSAPDARSRRTWHTSGKILSQPLISHIWGHRVQTGCLRAWLLLRERWCHPGTIKIKDENSDFTVYKQYFIL